MKIVHLDDHVLFSAGMSSLISMHLPDVRVLSMSNGRETLELLDKEQDVDLILMDLEMPGIDGFAMLDAIANRGLAIPIVILSGSEDLFDIRTVMEAGAVGFVPKSNKPEQLLEALNVVMGDVVYLPDDIKLALTHLPKYEPSNEIDRLLAEYNIGMKPFEVLKLMHKGYNTAEIAEMMHLSANTIKSHTSTLFGALGVKDRLKCVVRAGNLGLLKGA